MYPGLIAKQMIGFQKTALDNTYKSMVMLQNHTEKMASMLLDQTTWIPEESNRLVAQWMEIFKTSRNEYKSAMDDIFSRMQDLLDDRQ